MKQHKNLLLLMTLLACCHLQAGLHANAKQYTQQFAKDHVPVLLGSAVGAFFAFVYENEKMDRKFAILATVLVVISTSIVHWVKKGVPKKKGNTLQVLLIDYLLGGGVLFSLLQIITLVP